MSSKNKYRNAAYVVPKVEKNGQSSPQVLENVAKKDTENSKFRIIAFQILFLFVSSLMVWMVSHLPKNKEWLNTTVKNFYEQKTQLDTTQSIAFRQEVTGEGAVGYSNFLKQHCKPNDYFLIPPQKYLLANAYDVNVPKEVFAWVHPSLMYYYAKNAYKLLEMTQKKEINKATYTFWVQNKQVVLIKFDDSNRKLILDEFSKYDARFAALTLEQAQPFIAQK
jgi:hypothetical protein